MRWSFRNLGRNVLEYGLTFLVAVGINFMLPYAAPGDPLLYVIGPEATELSPEQRQAELERYGLDEPIPVQFVTYLIDALQGDLGTSLTYGRPVTEVLLVRLPWTLLLVGSALLLAALFGTVFGAISAWHEGDRTDIGLMSSIVFAMSAPGFWLGMLFIAIFAAWLGWFPSSGIRTGDPGLTRTEAALDVARHLVLPVATLTFVRLGSIFLIARNTVISTLAEDFLLFSRAKGLSDREVLYKHAVPNSLLPVYTRFTLQVGVAIGGAVVIETVFAIPGIGRVIFDAALNRDYPLLQGAFLVLVVTVIAANIFADLTYPFIDPRTASDQAEAGR